MLCGMAERSFQVGVVAAALSLDPREAPRLSRAAGFAGVQFDVAAGGIDLTDLSQTGRREFRHVLASADQQLAGIRVDVGPKGFGKGVDIDRLLARFQVVMEAARGLAAPLICVEVGPLPEPPPVSKPKPRITPEQAGLLIIPELSAPEETLTAPAGPPMDQPHLSLVDSAMLDLGARADRLGCTLAFRSDLASFAALDRMLAAARCPWFGIDLDPVAILRDAWPADEMFARLGALIRHLRGRDAVGGADRRTRPAVLGQGSTSWPEILQLLDEAGYHGWITIDPLELPDRAAAAIAGAADLRKVM
jgi:sugar phosphate isomerase/epimerase